MSELNSEQIVNLLKRGNEKGLTTLFDLYYERLYLFAERYIYDATKAHDIVQDVFLKIWEKAGQLDLHGSVRNYLFTAVRNGCLNYLKSLQIEDRHHRKYAEAYVESCNIDMVEEEEILVKVRMVLDELPEKCREVCVLRFVEGYKYREIAEKLDLNENTVKAHLHRGMDKLRRVLSAYDLVTFLWMVWVLGMRK